MRLGLAGAILSCGPILWSAGLCWPQAAHPRAPAPLAGTLTLDMADPIVSIRIGDVPLRLRVGLDQHDVIELNAAAVARLGLAFELGPSDDVGRIVLPSRIAGGSFEMNGRTVNATLSSHGDCCAGVDGAISPVLLPYAEIRFVRSRISAPSRSLGFVMEHGGDYGLEVRQRIESSTVRVQFALERVETLATAAAGAILANKRGGRFEGGYAPALVAFGIARPSRVIALARPVTLAGFHFEWIRTRTADFGGRHILPRDPEEAGDIVVKRPVAPQGAWPAIAIGRDRLDRCDEIRFWPKTLALTLRCDFDGAAG